MTVIERIPPQSIEAEQATIGSMILEKYAIGIIIDILTDDDFYLESHRIIFETIIELYSQNKPVDVLVLTEELKNKNVLDNIGGVAYIMDVMTKAPTAASAKYYALIVKEKADKRRMIKLADKLMNMGYDTEEKASDILEYAEKSIFNQFMNNQKKETFVSDYMSAKKVYNDIDDVLNGKPTKTIQTGIKYLDTMTNGGLRGGQMVIVAGTTSAGKTALALQVSNHVANNYQSVAYYSYEMKPHELMQRLLSASSYIPMSNIINSDLSANDMVNLAESVSSFKGKLNIDSSCPATVDIIKSRCRKLKMEKGLSMIVVDYLQQLSGDGHKDDRSRISKISRDLKLLALELDIPVIVVSQLNRDHLKREVKRPAMYDLKESGSIEMDADLILMLYRPGFFGAEELKKAGYPEYLEGITEVNIEKFRQGRKSSFHLDFDGEHSYFKPIVL